MITLHHLEKSRSFRIIWALEELGLNYDIKYYKRSPMFKAPEELKQIHPLGKAPILTDEHGVHAESAAILEYLQFDHEQFKPKNRQDLQQYQFWMHYAEGSIMPLLVFKLILNLSATKAPFLTRPLVNKVTQTIEQTAISPRLKDHVKFIEDYLETHEYFAGDFSFADIQMTYPLDAISKRTSFVTPNIDRYLKNIAQRIAYQTARQKE